MNVIYKRIDVNKYGPCHFLGGSIYFFIFIAKKVLQKMSTRLENTGEFIIGTKFKTLIFEMKIN